jgi:hypothetical protein
MSLYYSPSEICEARLQSVAREMAREIDTTIARAGPGGFLWVGRDEHRFGPAYDPASGVRVICSGHLAWSAHDWCVAERLPYKGGLGPRLLLERYLKGGSRAVAPYNGSTIVVVHDPRSSEHHVYTPASSTAVKRRTRLSSRPFLTRFWPIPQSRCRGTWCRWPS